MTNEEIKKTLEKQLQLLSKRSEDAPPETLCELTEAMVQIAKLFII